MQRLTGHGGGAGSLLRLFVLGLIMVPIMAAVMVRARVPEALAALAAFRGWIGTTGAGSRTAGARPKPPPAPAHTLAGQRTS